MAKDKNKKFELKLYVIKFEDGSYLLLNSEAENPKDIFGSTEKLSEATLLNKDLKEKMEIVIEEHNSFFYIEEAREFKKVDEIVSYGLFRV